MRIRGSRRNDEAVGEGRPIPEIEKAEVFGFFVRQRPTSQGEVFLKFLFVFGDGKAHEISAGKNGWVRR